ncbi:hypothetical protein [Paenibacillus sp. IHBB 10380]|uniref:hypothetical protein n=1 Tax=Paenibacillus sp. IHBB 10380 TaxID=1566358 RepID=UPI000AB8538F|nr:hypothetical protein [Paenibacillus sp. IHBB 10380]
MSTDIKAFKVFVGESKSTLLALFRELEKEDKNEIIEYIKLNISRYPSSKN